jgi:hypothetical protein
LIDKKLKNNLLNKLVDTATAADFISMRVDTLVEQLEDCDDNFASTLLEGLNEIELSYDLTNLFSKIRKLCDESV